MTCKEKKENFPRRQSRMQMPQLSEMRKIDISIISLRDSLAMNDDFVWYIGLYHRNKFGTNVRLQAYIIFQNHAAAHQKYKPTPNAKNTPKENMKN